MKNLEVTIKTAAATLFVLYTKVHIFHFNVTGQDFFQLHKMTDEIWKDMVDAFDGLNEQIRALDMVCSTSLTEILELSQIEDEMRVGEAKAMLYELLLDNDKLIEVLKEVNILAEPHPGLQNWVQNQVDKQEKTGWFLRSSIKGK